MCESPILDHSARQEPAIPALQVLELWVYAHDRTCHRSRCVIPFLLLRYGSCVFSSIYLGTTAPAALTTKIGSEFSPWADGSFSNVAGQLKSFNKIYYRVAQILLMSMHWIVARGLEAGYLCLPSVWCALCSRPERKYPHWTEGLNSAVFSDIVELVFFRIIKIRWQCRN